MSKKKEEIKSDDNSIVVPEYLADQMDALIDEQSEGQQLLAAYMQVLDARMKLVARRLRQWWDTAYIGFGLDHKQNYSYDKLSKKIIPVEDKKEETTVCFFCKEKYKATQENILQHRITCKLDPLAEMYREWAEKKAGTK